MALMLVEVRLFCLLFFSLIVQQPIRLGFFLLFYCFLSSVLVFSFFSSWFSLSLFLIYIRGMLVLFGYVLVLIPNFVFSVKIFPVLFFLSFFLFVPFPSGSFSFDLFNYSLSFFSFSNIIVYLSLGLILFVGLVSVAKICFFQVGSLRPFFLSYV